MVGLPEFSTDDVAGADKVHRVAMSTTLPVDPALGQVEWHAVLWSSERW